MFKEHSTVARYAEDYAKHQLREHSATPSVSTWLIRGDGIWLWQRVIATDSHLIIVGDGPDLIIWGGPARHEAKVRWAAGAGLDYLASKVLARSGCNRNGQRPGRDWCGELAEGELLREGLRAFEEWNFDHATACRDALADARGCDDRRDFFEAVARHLDDAWEYSFGEHIAREVIGARAALQRLVQLIDRSRAMVVYRPRCTAMVVYRLQIPAWAQLRAWGFAADMTMLQRMVCSLFAFTPEEVQWVLGIRKSRPPTPRPERRP